MQNDIVYSRRINIIYLEYERMHYRHIGVDGAGVITLVS